VTRRSPTRTDDGRPARRGRALERAVTTLLDRLERAGYVRRIADKSDRRRVLVELTDTARAREGEIWGAIAEEWAERSAGFTDEQLVFLRDFLVEGREFLALHTVRVKEE
jgi:DNA-binding MarR family transcriptional regulator